MKVMKIALLTLVAALVICNIAWYEHVNYIQQQDIAYRQSLVNRFDNEYFTFCYEANREGIGTKTQQYADMCGNH